LKENNIRSINKPHQNIYDCECEVKKYANLEENELVFTDGDTISGEIFLNLKDVEVESFEHSGVTIELIGVMTTHDGNKTELIRLSKELDCAGIISKNVSYGFSFKEVNFPFESYYGELCSIRYYIKASIGKSFLSIKTREELDITSIKLPTNNKSTNYPLEVEASCSQLIGFVLKLLDYHIAFDGIIVGSIKFKELRVTTKQLFIQIIKKETLISKYFLSIKYYIICLNKTQKKMKK
jgi:vacuolar protein sorting-associated protein 26